MASVKKLAEGYKRFYARYFNGDCKLYHDLASNGQSPKTLMISCSDSRVSPIILTDADPGDIFEIRNVANIVPPYQPQFDSYHGTSAAIEFAVNFLKVENIVVMGHSNCGGIQALVDAELDKDGQKSFISDWVKISSGARSRALLYAEQMGENKYTCCEKESIKDSVNNLMSFPWIKDKVDAGKLKLHGWYFSIADGKLYTLDGPKFKLIT